MLDLPSLKIEAVAIQKTKIEIVCSISKSSATCPVCKQESSRIHQHYTRKLRDMNLSGREVYLKVKVRQFVCKTCNKYFAESLDFADDNSSHTLRQTDFMFLVGSKQSYSESAVILNTHPKTVSRIILAICKKMADVALRYASVRRLGIDEQSHQKGKKDYICVLTDLDRGIIVDMLRTRKKADLIAHFQGLGANFCKQITDVSCDNWKPYLSVIEVCFPQATVILDRFHVTKSLNESLDNFRKELLKA